MIFGRHTDREQPDRKVDVDVHLEEDITLVQTATDAFLNNPKEDGRWAGPAFCAGKTRPTKGGERCL